MEILELLKLTLSERASFFFFNFIFIHWEEKNHQRKQKELKGGFCLSQYFKEKPEENISKASWPGSQPLSRGLREEDLCVGPYQNILPLMTKSPWDHSLNYTLTGPWPKKEKGKNINNGPLDWGFYLFVVKGSEHFIQKKACRDVQNVKHKDICRGAFHFDDGNERRAQVADFLLVPSLWVVS